jgi:hypothetical protein
MTNGIPTPEESKVLALQAYDRVVIVADLIMEHWLEGNANPPKELIDAYYDAVEEATFFINGNRLHESVVRPNSDFYEEIHGKFGLENFKKKLDNTPDLF